MIRQEVESAIRTLVAGVHSISAMRRLAAQDQSRNFQQDSETASFAIEMAEKRAIMEIMNAINRQCPDRL